MADATESNFLQINGAGDVDAIALKVYGGMVLETFNKRTTTEGRIMQRTITSGKSAAFPVIGTASTITHTAGEEIVDQAVSVLSAERIITIEDILMSPIFVDVLADAKSHFDIFRPYATQQGQALAEESDKRAFMAMIAAANASANITGGDAGHREVDAAIGTNVATLIASIYDAAEALDEHNVSSDGRSLWLAPAQFYLVLEDGEFIDTDFGGAGNGARSSASMRRAADFEIVKTNNLPTANETANTALPTSTRLNFSNTVACASHSSAAGILSLIGLMFEREYQINRQGTLLVAKYARGFDYLRPEAAIEFASA